MRILSVIPAMGVGGAEVVTATLIRDARRRGHDVRLASGGGFRADDLIDDGVPHIRVPLDSRRPADLARSARILRAEGRRESPDLVHAHNVKAAVIARVAFGRRVPILVTFHGVPHSAERTSARLLHRVADQVVAVSPHAAQRLATHGLAASKLVTIENAVTPVEAHDQAAVRDSLCLDPDAVVVLCLARLVEQKRHDLLLDAWPRVCAELGDRRPTLLIAGDGPLRPDLEARARTLSGVRFLGPRTDPDRLLAAADLVVLPTDWEGLPISLLEAMSVGVPVAVSRVGGVIETLGDAVRLVSPGSAEALADALIELCGDPAARTRLGARGAELAGSRFATPVMLQRYDDAYHRLSRSTAEESSHV